ncbi:MAG: bifunctional nuclease family protein [Anaerolineales bacterium]|jgi:bifunctional DNase/RNase
MAEMIEVVIDSIRYGLMSQNRVVILREENADRYLAIWIDSYMAEQITFALQEVEVARPMSHDLMKQIIQSLNARIVRVEVVDLKNEVFYGNIVVETDAGYEINIDSRPSDAISLAVRTNVPVLVAKKVMDEAGIIPDDDLSEQVTGGRDQMADEDIPEGEDRLSVFQDFLDDIDIDEEDDDDEDDKKKSK